MRIAFLVHDYRKSGGHARYVYELATRFSRDHDVHVFATQIEDLDNDKIKFHRVWSWRVTSLTGVLTYILPATMLPLSTFDIVHAQGLCGFRQNVVTAHICLAGWFDALQKVCGRLSLKQRLFRALVQPLERLIFQPGRTQTVIAVSQRVRADLERYYARKSGVTVIYQGVDTAAFHPANRALWRSRMRAEWNIPDGRFVALYVGDLQKGARPALAALAETPDATLLFVSATPSAAFRSLAEEFGVAERTLFLPSTKTIERMYAAADAFLFPSAYDTFGLVVGEAMSSGLPVLTSAAVGAAELVEHGRSGVVIDPAWDAGAYAAWLRKFVADPALRAAMGAAARTAIEAYNWDRTAAETLAVYEQMNAVKHRRPPALKAEAP